MTPEVSTARQYGLREAAALVRSVRGSCCVDTLRRAIRRGRLRAVRDPGGRLYVPGAELARWLNLAEVAALGGRTPAEARRGDVEALARLRRMGYDGGGPASGRPE